MGSIEANNPSQKVNFPLRIEITFFENGFVAKLNSSSSFYENFEILVKEVQPCIRQELNGCKGNC